MAAKIDWNELLEHMILGRIVTAMMDAGYRVVTSIEDAPDYLYVYGIKDNRENKPRGGYTHWVKCVPGNGSDFISDYTTNLESVLQPISETISLFQR